jgi:hypothetical protein
VTSNGVSSDPRVATIKKNEERIEDLILIRLSENNMLSETFISLKQETVYNQSNCKENGKKGKLMNRNIPTVKPI